MMLRRTAPAPVPGPAPASLSASGSGAGGDGPERAATGHGSGSGSGSGNGSGHGGGRRDTLRTEFAFELPRGYVDDAGVVHRTGVMRLATARDELVPLRDDRVRENSAYLSVVLIARVVTRIGTIDDVHPGVIEDLFASDLAFLQDFYRRINAEGHTRAAVTCPACQEEFAVNLAGGRLGES